MAGNTEKNMTQVDGENGTNFQPGNALCSSSVSIQIQFLRIVGCTTSYESRMPNAP